MKENNYQGILKLRNKVTVGRMIFFKDILFYSCTNVDSCKHGSSLHKWYKSNKVYVQN